MMRSPVSLATGFAVRPRASLLAALTALLVLWACGCGPYYNMAARDAFVRQQMSELVYERPAQEVFTAARTLLFERGYGAAPQAESSKFTFQTDWKETVAEAVGFAPPGTDRRRFLVQVTEVDAQRSRATLTYQHEKKECNECPWKSIRAERDIEMELALLERVDPRKAAAIAAEADRRGQPAAEP